MSVLTIDTKNNCYVIDAKQMDNLQQNVATSFTLENGTFEIKITDGSYSFAQSTTAGEPFVLLWIYGVDGNKFINKTTGYEVGATWTTLNGYNDSLQLEVKDAAVIYALFFDVNNIDNSGIVNLAITSDKPFFNPQTLTVDSKNNCYVLEEEYLNTLKQAGSNFVELNPGTYRLKISEGNAKYWADNQKFNLEPWALVSVKGGKVVTKLTGIEVQETWVSLNGLKDEVILEIKEKTTLCGLFFDTYKEDNEGHIILAIESVCETELAELYAKQENNLVTEKKEENTVTNETLTTQVNQDEYKSRELVGVTSGIEFSFHLNEEEFKRKWEEQWESVRKSINISDKSVTLEGKYWDQLEQWLLRNYENQFKNLSIEVAKVRFSMDTYIQQMEFSLNEHLKSWSKHLDKLVKDKVNVEISNKIHQQINHQIDLTFEQRIRNNVGVIINNLVHQQELNQYIDQHVNQQVNQTFEQTVRNNVAVIINNLVNKQELNQYIDQHVNQQVNQTFEQTVRNNVALIVNNLVNKQELNQYIDQHVSQQVNQTFEQTVRNNVALIVNNLVNKQELNQYIDQHVNQQVDQTFEQKIQNNISLITQNVVNNAELNQYFNQQIDNSFELNFQNHIHAITQNIVNDNDVLNQYFDQRLQLAVTNNTEINNDIVNIVSNSTEINNKIENIRNEWNQNFISLVIQKVEEVINILGGHEAFIKLITQNIVKNNTELNQYVSLQIDNSYEQKIQAYIKLITQNIVNDNDVLNQYFDQRLQLAITNNTEVNNNIVNVVTNSTEINNKIENIRNEWNQNFISLVTQKVGEVINILGGHKTFINLITQNIVNDNDVINQYFDQRLQQNVTNNLVINQLFDNSHTVQKIENLVINSNVINNRVLNFIINSTEINNKINHVYKDIDIKIENVRNEWKNTFLSLITQYVDEVINIIGDSDSFNLQIANVINVKVDELLSQILRIRNELTVIINNADRNLYEWTLGELMVIKGCLTDREVLVEQLVTFSSQLRTKLDTTTCVDINNFKPFKPISVKPAELPIAQPRKLPES